MSEPQESRESAENGSENTQSSSVHETPQTPARNMAPVSGFHPPLWGPYPDATTPFSLISDSAPSIDYTQHTPVQYPGANTWTPAPVPHHSVYLYHPTRNPLPYPTLPPTLQVSPPTSHPFEDSERQFAAGLFEGLLYPKEKRKRSRAKYVFPEGMTEEAMAVFLYRCMDRTGFSIGQMLRIFFSGKHTFYPPEYNALAQAISSFLRSESLNESPVAIVEYFFQHPKSLLNVDMRVDRSRPVLSIPPYAFPPSVRLDGSYSPDAAKFTSARNSLLNWSFGKTMGLVDEESDRLLHASLGFTRAPKETLTWSSLTSWSLTASQEAIAKEAPALFALLSTLAVNSSTRKRVELARHIRVPHQQSPEPMPPSSPPQYSFEPSEEGEKMDVDSIGSPLRRAEAIGVESDSILRSSSAQSGNGDTPAPEALEDTNEALPEPADSTPFLDATPPSLAGVPVNTKRDPWLGVTIAILSLLFFRYKYAIVFPTVIGIFLFTCNANRDLISVLGRIGITVAYDTILTSLHLLAFDADTQLRSLASLLKGGQPQFLLLFDNVNKMRRAWQPTAYHKDEMQSGTAATLVQLEDVPDGALRSKPLQDALKEKRRQALTVDALLDDINWGHVEGVGTASILRVWVKHVPALRKFQPNVELLFSKTHSVHPLRLRKSKIIPMRPTAIDEATTGGTLDVLRNLIVGQLRILPNWLDPWLVLVCGDQLTVDRLRKSKRYMAKTDTPYDRQEWVLPVIQLWHLKWNWQKAIVRIHWQVEGLGDGVHGLRRGALLLRRDKFNPTRCDFYAAHHILEDEFDALVLDALRLVCEDETLVVHPPNTKLLDGLELYFATEEKLLNIRFEYLCAMAEQVYHCYLTAGAADEAREPEDEGRLPDVSLANTINLMRCTFWYLELCAATAEGDIGRVFEIVKLLRFSFWGAGSTNYGNELLELACNFLYEFSAALRDAIYNNYLVNPSGKPGHWFELDLLQEHFNFWLKRLFNSKSHSFDSRHLAEAVGLNIAGFSLLRDNFPSIFGLRGNKHAHTDPEKHTDINILGEHYRSEGVLTHQSGRSQPFEVLNEFGKGLEILESGQLKTFLNRTMNDGPVTDEEMGPSGVAAEGTNDFPTNPIVMEGGETMVQEFIGGNTGQKQ